jgi:hypothetical protein
VTRVSERRRRNGIGRGPAPLQGHRSGRLLGGRERLSRAIRGVSSRQGRSRGHHLERNGHAHVDGEVLDGRDGLGYFTTNQVLSFLLPLKTALAKRGWQAALRQQPQSAKECGPRACCGCGTSKITRTHARRPTQGMFPEKNPACVIRPKGTQTAHKSLRLSQPELSDR